MCWDENCHGHDCHCEHSHCDCHEHEIYNGYNEWDVVWEADFQIVDKDELENMRNNKEIWWNLWDDLVNMWFISEDDEIYNEMKNEKRDWVMYDI
jgi:hypothetical protein